MSTSSQEKIKTIDVRDKRLNQPSVLTHSSIGDISEMKKSILAQSNRKTNQSFATVKQTDESPTVMDNLQESQMSRFMPAVFSTTFS